MADPRPESPSRAALERVAFQSSLLEHVRNAVIATDLEGNITYVNRAAERLFACTSDEVLGRSFRDVYVALDERHLEEPIRRAVLERGTWEGQITEVRHDGVIVPTLTSVAALTDAQGIVRGFVSVKTDIRELQERERSLARLTEFRRSVLELVEESLRERDADAFYGRVLRRAVGVIPGAQAGSVLLRAPDGMFEFVATEGYDLERLRSVRMTEAQVSLGGRRTVTPVLITDFTPDDADRPADHETLLTEGRLRDIRVSLSIPVVLDGVAVAHLSLDNFESTGAYEGEAVEMARVFAGHVAALVQRFRLERELHRLAYSDALTGLPNRAFLKERLAEALAPERAAGVRAAVLFVDLDNLKPVNDTLGHRAGDEVLREVARRLSACAGSGDIVVRLSGDEFTLVTFAVDTHGAAAALAERIRAALVAPIAVEGERVRSSASIGVSLYPEDATSPEELLRRADIAMYHAKQSGKDTFAFFEDEMEAALGSRDLRR